MESSSSRNKLHNCQRSVSPSGRFCSSTISSSFTTQNSNWLTRPTSPSPTRVNLRRSVSPSPSVRFSSNPNRSISVFPRHPQQNTRPLPSNKKKHCTCSPTTHPGSFRCSLHKNTNKSRGQSHTSSYHSSHQLNIRRSAMTNSLVRIGTVEGELVKRALAALIRPSSHHLRRRCDFQPRPSRLSVMSKTQDLL
ncbi:hypothetical protein K7X08_004086 [Anisodus acutangulus]|uniref:Serine-rich protein-like protein n=1 Tax=Anisodus acutangulus TaxID=402998 RepID=A0A9Q1MK12_9SOLA|nr:hypothetical protein K7X08_004086 [Anisodus acutangulus]